MPTPGLFPGSRTRSLNIMPQVSGQNSCRDCLPSEHCHQAGGRGRQAVLWLSQQPSSLQVYLRTCHSCRSLHQRHPVIGIRAYRHEMKPAHCSIDAGNGITAPAPATRANHGHAAIAKHAGLDLCLWCTVKLSQKWTYVVWV